MTRQRSEIISEIELTELQNRMQESESSTEIDDLEIRDSNAMSIDSETPTTAPQNPQTQITQSNLRSQ